MLLSASVQAKGMSSSRSSRPVPVPPRSRLEALLSLLSCRPPPGPSAKEVSDKRQSEWRKKGMEGYDNTSVKRIRTTYYHIVNLQKRTVGNINLTCDISAVAVRSCRVAIPRILTVLLLQLLLLEAQRVKSVVISRGRRQ